MRAQLLQHVKPKGLTNYELEQTAYQWSRQTIHLPYHCQYNVTGEKGYWLKKIYICQVTYE